MPTGPRDLECLADRLAKLEAQNRMFKRGAALIAILFIAFLAMGQSHSQRVIEATEFVLKDKTGAPRARLYMEDSTHPALYFYGADNSGIPIALKAGDEPSIILNRAGSKEQVLVAANKQFFGIVLYDDKSHRAGLSVQKGDPGLDLFDQDGNPRVSIQAFATESAIRLFDTKRSSSVELANAQGGSALEFLDPGGEVTLGLRKQNSGPRLELRDKQGFSAVLGNTSLVVPRTGKTENTSAASLVLFDKDGKVLSSAP